MRRFPYFDFRIGRRSLLLFGLLFTISMNSVIMVLSLANKDSSSSWIPYAFTASAGILVLVSIVGTAQVLL